MRHRWTATDIPDLHGRTVIVTGANSGLGLATARGLAGHGAHTVLACRNEQRGARAVAQLRNSVPRADLELATLDLADLASVRAFAERFLSEHSELDVLINNAGIMAVPRATTVDGFESHIGINHLGHFALTGLLLPALLARPHARVVTVSAGLHRVGRISIDDLNRERRYQRWLAYGQSKLANLIFTFELHRRAVAAGLELRAIAAHPGYAATNLQTAPEKSRLDRRIRRSATGSSRRVPTAEPGQAFTLPPRTTCPAGRSSDPMASGNCVGIRKSCRRATRRATPSPPGASGNCPRGSPESPTRSRRRADCEASAIDVVAARCPASPTHSRARRERRVGEHRRFGARPGGRA